MGEGAGVLVSQILVLASTTTTPRGPPSPGTKAAMGSSWARGPVSWYGPLLPYITLYTKSNSSLSSNNNDRKGAFKPWNKGRDGFIMGEGAGVRARATAALSYDTVDKTWATPPTTLLHRAITIPYGNF
jgi:hypothetical protein